MLFLTSALMDQQQARNMARPHLMEFKAPSDVVKCEITAVTNAAKGQCRES